MKRTLLFALIAVMIVLPNIASYQRVDGRDTGIFSYVAQQILNGKALYRDAWDSKGPLIFYLYALGIAIGNLSGWGLWFINVLFVYVALLFGDVALRNTFGRRAAAFGTWGWLAGLLILSSNLNIELATLPLQFAALYLFVRWQEKPSVWYTALIGITGAIAFLTRANNAGMQVSIGLLIFLSGVRARQWKSTTLSLLALLFGATITLIIVAAYFASQNTLPDLIDASLVYNMSYSNSTLLLRLHSALYGLAVLSGVTVVALTGLLLVSVKDLRARLQSVQLALLSLALVDLPIELVFATFSGRDYRHYYITWLPAFAILIGFCGHVFWTENGLLMNRLEAVASRALSGIGLPPDNTVSRMFVAMPEKVRNPSLLLLGLSTLLVLNGMLFRIPRIVESLGASPSQPVAEFIQSHTQREDYVLMWGAEIGYNFLTGRPSPSRYGTQYPLFTQGYQTPAMVKELLDNIAEKKPLIIDCSSSDSLSPPIDDAKRKNWRPKASSWGLLPQMDDVFNYIHANYQPVGVVGSNQWIVYEYINH